MSQEISNKIRIIRIISMFMIIMCHILQYHNNSFAFWLNVGVQIFFLISGVLYGTKKIDDYKKFWKSRLKNIIMPYYLTIIPFFIVSLLLNNVYYKTIDIFYYLTFSQAFNTSITSISHLWFISFILLFYLLLPVLNKFDISKDKHFNVKLLVIIIIIQIFQFLNVHNVNSTYLALFITGFYLSRRYFIHKENINYKKLFIILCSLTVIGITIQLYLEMLTMPSIINKFFILYKDYVHALLGITLFLAFIKLIPANNNKLITYFSNISYSIYLVHQIFIFGPYCVLDIKYGFVLFILLVLLFSNLLYYINKFLVSRVLK